MKKSLSIPEIVLLLPVTDPYLSLWMCWSVTAVIVGGLGLAQVLLNSL